MLNSLVNEILIFQLTMLSDTQTSHSKNPKSCKFLNNSVKLKIDFKARSQFSIELIKLIYGQFIISGWQLKTGQGKPFVEC